MSILTVPPEYIDSFRAAVRQEIDHDARVIGDEEWIRENCERSNLLDLPGQIDLLNRDLALLGRLEQTGGEPVNLDDVDVETLAHAAETMAQKVVGLKLSEQLEYGPLDEFEAGKLRPLIAELSWAIERAAELHGRARDAEASV